VPDAAGAGTEAVPTDQADPASGSPEVGAHDHAWHSVSASSLLTYSDYQCSLCGITWSL
jgi:hypothetical protein